MRGGRRSRGNQSSIWLRSVNEVTRRSLEEGLRSGGRRQRQKQWLGPELGGRIHKDRCSVVVDEGQPVGHGTSGVTGGAGLNDG
ncbi:hypothetical protein M6B38_140795 [Iris pallida]|uniref:Uncharacterized protein n=1 Tax=Iris pallida TaxID=29817 RepID=A0AAX6FDF4_IRIPA|nr:hypothetical protein M6B38_140795 [Iris pallida]